MTVAVEMPAEDRAELTRWMRSPSMPAGLAQRARIVLLAAEGVGTNEIVHRIGVSKPTVIAWKKRYAAEGIAGLDDRPKPGRPAQVDEVAVVLATLEPPPEQAGGDALVLAAAGRSPSWASPTCGSPGSGASGACSRGGARRSSSPPTRSWRPRSATSSGCIWPRRRRRWCSRSTRSRQIQALDRTAPILPMRPGPAGEGDPRLRPARHHHAVRRPGDRDRQDHRRLLPPAPQRRVPAVPQAGRQGLPAGRSCTWSWTTTPPTSTRACRPGSPRTRGSPCTSPRPRGPG